MTEVQREEPCLMARFLTGLAEGFEDLVDSAGRERHPFRLEGAPQWSNLDYEKFLGRRVIKKTLDNAQKAKYLELRNEGDRCYYKLTEKGRIYALKHALRSSLEYMPDGRYCVVVFDIPEAARPVRDRLRRLLKNIGFERVQLSVWRSKKDIVFALRAFIEAVGLARWVRVMTVSDVGGRL